MPSNLKLALTGVASAGALLGGIAAFHPSPTSATGGTVDHGGIQCVNSGSGQAYCTPPTDRPDPEIARSIAASNPPEGPAP